MLAAHFGLPLDSAGNPKPKSEGEHRPQVVALQMRIDNLYISRIQTPISHILHFLTSILDMVYFAKVLSRYCWIYQNGVAGVRRRDGKHPSWRMRWNVESEMGKRIIVIGSGFGGLAAAARLASFSRHSSGR